MFNRLSACPGTIPGMHLTAERLYAIAKAMRGIESTSALAEALDESHQTVFNWGARGVSVPGALKAQQAFGCDANWLLSGEGHVLAGWPFSGELLEAVRALNSDGLLKAENTLRVHLDLGTVPGIEAVVSETPTAEDVALFEQAHTSNAKPGQRKRAA
jgi:hypothetical protein